VEPERPGDGSQLDCAPGELRSQCERSVPLCTLQYDTENLQALYGALWAPIEQALPSGMRRIIISPDGQLNFISFATLLDKDQQFLAQRYSVQYVRKERGLAHAVNLAGPFIMNSQGKP